MENVNIKVLEKFINLSNALEAVGIPSEIRITPENEIMMSCPVWNCIDGSGFILEFLGDNDDDEVAHAVSPANCSYEELYERY